MRQLEKEVKHWQQLANMQGKTIDHLTMAAEPPPVYSAKNPAKPTTPKPAKPRK